MLRSNRTFVIRCQDRARRRHERRARDQLLDNSGVASDLSRHQPVAGLQITGGIPTPDQAIDIGRVILVELREARSAASPPQSPSAAGTAENTTSASSQRSLSLLCEPQGSRGPASRAHHTHERNALPTQCVITGLDPATSLELNLL